GATEDLPAAPIGEYAQSCLARERVFEHFAHVHGTCLAIVRLAYAVELRYGVLLDLARKVWEGEPIDLAMGHTNAIWQGDACELTLRLLPHASAPPLVLNLTGLDTLSVRQLAERFGNLLGHAPNLHGVEAPTALLTNARRAADLIGTPTTPIEDVVRWVAAWVQAGGRTLNKPTHFEVRDGRY
ncbi:MAG: NAD(P)-dependent oxidoreductase, partial [Actinobacteria bacterium]|nr:NAD(P)-dependent oxidoreductase [Actinomycetota bacterium]